MQDFIEALISESKNTALPDEFNYFGKLIGSWEINYIEGNNSLAIKGEWHFSWVLEGMAIQDVIILPDYEYGTSLRIYNPDTHTWDVAYGYTGKIIRLEAKKQDDMIMLTFVNNERRKWVFTKIEDDCFHWENITVKEDGEWYINAEIFAERIL
ncbi:hypothetical protein EAI28_00885 [Faecalicatena contorta]|uniref:hypothetical protein n=1 Tax=Faecalicatena contorta TaxID=39482 RepID=UPI00129E089D|nr:hypothetical protein [Faecalicatena contorta]MRM86924.1 hypothetical protein [Faecalicatena contorta]